MPILFSSTLWQKSKCPRRGYQWRRQGGPERPGP